MMRYHRKGGSAASPNTFLGNAGSYPVLLHKLFDFRADRTKTNSKLAVATRSVFQDSEPREVTRKLYLFVARTNEYRSMSG